MSPPPIGASEALCFLVVRPGMRASVGPFVRSSVRQSVRPDARVLLARYLANLLAEFHQTLTDDVVHATDELFGFRRSRDQSQGYSKVKHLVELLRRAEASPSTVGHRSIVNCL